MERPTCEKCGEALAEWESGWSGESGVLCQLCWEAACAAALWDTVDAVAQMIAESDAPAPEDRRP